MTKRERLYHSLVKCGQLSSHKLAKKKLRDAKNRKKPTGIYIDMAYLRECIKDYTMDDLIKMAMEQNIILCNSEN